mmetsp:Transcript_112051/g.302358  ORF Transcript_112051/g.302358 Transcript_112051/m.302358 type:complete len:84 (+) Transcript_112051:716-967(+)
MCERARVREVLASSTGHLALRKAAQMKLDTFDPHAEKVWDHSAPRVGTEADLRGNVGSVFFRGCASSCTVAALRLNHSGPLQC